MDSSVIGSILALDIGTAFTKAALFDLVEGRRRFIAIGHTRSTLDGENASARRGVVEAVRQIESVAGHPLLGTHGLLKPERVEGHGVDSCFQVSSAGDPLRVIVVGPTLPLVSKAAAESLAVPGVQVVLASSRDAQLPAGESQMGQIIGALHRDLPDVVVVVESSPPALSLAELSQTIAIGARSARLSPSIVYVGGEDGCAALRRAIPRPDACYALPASDKAGGGVSPLQERLQALWLERWQSTEPGAATLDEWSESAALPVEQGFANAVRFLAAHGQTDVCALDIGASCTTIVAVAGGSVTTRVHRNLGLGRGCSALMAEPASVGRWLPSPLGDREVADAILHKSLHPQTLPESKGDVEFDGAMAREVAARALHDFSLNRTPNSRVPLLLLGRGGIFSESAGVGRAVLLLLDSFQPNGLVELAVDPLGTLPMLGAMAARLPEAAAELILGEGIRRLGPCVGVSGLAKGSGLAARVTVAGGGRKEPVPVPAGKLVSVPIDEGTSVTVTIHPTGRLDCGAGPGRKAVYEVRGGPFGLLVDARGRPVLADGDADAETRIRRLAAWRRALDC